MGLEAPQDSAGPSSPPPPLPEGWLAQWEGLSRKWYFVQRATGKAQWEIPTEPVILTPSTTPTPTPNSTETGPTRAPLSRPQANSPQAAITGLTAAAAAGVTGSDRTGISSFFGSQGSAQHGGFSMLNSRLSNQFVHAMNKPNGYNGHTAQQAYGVASGHDLYRSLSGHLSQYQNGHQQNPFGYSSTTTGQIGTYTGSVSQYQPSGQQLVGPASVAGLSGGSSQPGAGFAGDYAVDHSGSLSAHFTSSTSSSHHYPAQLMMASSLPNQYQASAANTYSGLGSSGVSVSSVWKLGSQPSVPLSTKPSVTQSQAPLNSGGSTSQQYYSNQSFTGTQFPASEYPATQTMNAYSHASVGQPFSTQPGSAFGQSSQSIQGNAASFQDIQGLSGLVSQHGQHHTPNAYTQYPSYQAGQHGSLFTAKSLNTSTPPTTASGVSNDAPLGSAAFGTTYALGTKTSSLSNQHSNTSLNGYFGSTTQQINGSGMGAELTESQVSASYYTPTTTQTGGGAAIPAPGPFQPQQQSSSHHYPFGNVSELLAGSEPHRPADPQFVSGPWTSFPGGNGGGGSYPQQQQSRYGPYGGGGGFR